ncbi:hypothetical protein [Bacillus sp. M6-12]|uniref:hypothetical protein n=1 Tax=Bacillus sp. M6-12 TaxID=2054166 RepID=UPI0011574728|nr:hypothetical protein [Bacillus sp. M6-12]
MDIKNIYLTGQWGTIQGELKQQASFRKLMLGKECEKYENPLQHNTADFRMLEEPFLPEEVLNN